MSSPRPTFTRAFATFVGIALVSAGVVAGLGCVTTTRLLADADVPAVLAGCGISWLASCIGAIPVARALAEGAPRIAIAILAATAIRFVTVLILVIPLVFSPWFDRTVLVASVGVSYLLMLAVDTLLAIQMTKRVFQNEQ